MSNKPATIVPLPRPQSASPSPAAAGMIHRSTIVLIGGAIILSIAMGVRQSYGLFTTPLAIAGLPVATFAFAIALQNLIWGIAQPFAGAAADRWGAAWVVVLGGALYAGGLALTAFGGDAMTAVIGAGICVGLGISAVSFSVVLGAIGRSVPESKRSMALGLASAGGSFGQVVVPLAAQYTIEAHGVGWSFYALAAVSLLMIPLALSMAAAPAAKKPADSGAAAVLEAAQPLSAALTEARRHNGYILLTIGFFVCGFQLSFLGVHLPGFLATCHLPPEVGARALAVIGFFNMIGSWACGYLGSRMRPKYLLSAIYLIRALAIVAFLALPKTELNVLLFAGIMGLIWLGTVPLTSELLSGIFGTKHMGTLFGVVFFSHQVGSFLGTWLGGYVFTQTGSYDLVWAVTVIAGVAAAIIHLPIADHSVRAVAVPA